MHNRGQRRPALPRPTSFQGPPEFHAPSTLAHPSCPRAG
ncbi:hypothetical protein L533_0819, partial [Bordetella bronchiseptica OSU553]